MGISPILAQYFSNDSLPTYAFALGLLPLARLVHSTVDNILIVEQQTFKLSIIRILYGIITLCIIVVASRRDWSFVTFMQYFVANEVLFAVVAYVVVSRFIDIKVFGVDFELIRKILLFSLPLGLASTVGSLNIEAGKLMVGYFFNTDIMAIYTNAAREMPVTIIASSITAVLMPRLVRLLNAKKTDEACYLWGQATLLSYIFICFFATALFVFAPRVISLLYSTKYLSGEPVFRVYCLVILLRTTYFGMILNSIGKTSIIFYCSILTLVLNIILSFILLYYFGVIGLAIATLMSIALVNYLQLQVTAKVLMKPLGILFPWKKLMYVTLVNVCLGMLFYIILNIIPDGLIWGVVGEVIIVGIVWLGVYVLMMRNEVVSLWSHLNAS